TLTDASESNNSFSHIRGQQENKAYPINELEDSEEDQSSTERLGDSDDDEELDILQSNLLNDNSQRDDPGAHFVEVNASGNILQPLITQPLREGFGH
ncbi:hypothetical protein EPUL_006546, partial [Erysiphe pulchra]